MTLHFLAAGEVLFAAGNLLSSFLVICGVICLWV
jgi:hypothetical protein